MDRDIVGVIKGEGWTATLTKSKGWVVEGESDDLDLITVVCKAYDPDYLAATRTLVQGKYVEALNAASRTLRVPAEFNEVYTRDYQTEANQDDKEG